jgi:hypothetical protein
MWWIAPLLIIIAGMLNATMDALKVRFKTSIFQDWKGQQWINPAISWHTKWGIDTKIFGKQINIVDKIMSTVLVWVTDMWHLAKMLMLVCISLAIVLYIPVFAFWLDALILYCLFTITFEIFFSRILIKKTPKI